MSRFKLFAWDCLELGWSLLKALFWGCLFLVVIGCDCYVGQTYGDGWFLIAMVGEAALVWGVIDWWDYR